MTGIVQIGSIHSNALFCRIDVTRSSLSAKTGIFVDAGKRIGKAGKVNEIVSSGQERWDI
jgi:hypothetical protein